MEVLKKELFPRNHHLLPLFLSFIALIVGLAFALGAALNYTAGGGIHASNETSNYTASAGQVCNGSTVVCQQGLSCISGICQNKTSALDNALQTISKQALTYNLASVVNQYQNFSFTPPSNTITSLTLYRAHVIDAINAAINALTLDENRIATLTMLSNQQHVRAITDLQTEITALTIIKDKINSAASINLIVTNTVNASQTAKGYLLKYQALFVFNEQNRLLSQLATIIAQMQQSTNNQNAANQLSGFAQTVTNDQAELKSLTATVNSLTPGNGQSVLTTIQGMVATDNQIDSDIQQLATQLMQLNDSPTSNGTPNSTGPTTSTLPSTPTVSPTAGPVSCIPRPSCLDATPKCMIAEPANGWCPSTNPTPTGYVGQPCGSSACPVGTVCKAVSSCPSGSLQTASCGAVTLRCEAE